MRRQPENASMPARNQSASNQPAPNQPAQRGGFLRNVSIFNRSAKTPESAKRGRLLLESLEPRQLMAGDVEMAFTGSAEANSNSNSVVTSSTTSSLTDRAAQGELAPNLVEFAKALDQAGVKMFGAYWCPFCTEQKQLFQDGAKYLNFIEVTNPDRTPSTLAVTEGITSYPTWRFPGVAEDVEGVLTLARISELSGITIPQGETPSFATIGNKSVQIGAPLNIPIDAYDPDGGPLTVTVSVEKPELLEAKVLTGNRSIRIDMNGYEDMVFELFETDAPRATGRVVQLANQNFYDGIVFHRIVNGFVIQGGDPTGTGGGGSTLGDFDDDFNANLVHTGSGLLSFAKSTDDTNDSQFFITEGPQRFLDFNHSVFGQLVEGEKTREAISNHAVVNAAAGNNTPTKPITMTSVDVFDDTENSVVRLTAKGNQAGTTNVTFTIRDQNNRTFTETISVSVVADNANSQPFLSPITAPAQVSAGTPATLQLSSADVEGDPVAYFAQSIAGPTTSAVVRIDNTVQQLTQTVSGGLLQITGGSSSAPIQVQLSSLEANPTYFATLLSSSTGATVNVNSTTGLVTVTPSATSTGTISVAIGSKTTRTVNGTPTEVVTRFMAQSITNPVLGTVSVNQSTGAVTVTPAAGFTSTIDAGLGVQFGAGVTGNAASDNDLQVVPFRFGAGETVVTAPTGVDLLAASDTGSSNTDNFTNASSLTFTVTGVTTGAQIELINTATGSVIGVGSATTTNATITTNNIAALGDGTYSIAARQSVNGQTSANSVPLSVTYDTAPPSSVVASAITTANIGREYRSDLINSEEGAGLVYRLVTAPTSATINATSGEIVWTPTVAQTGPNNFNLELTDRAGNKRTESFSVNVAGRPDAEIKLTVTDLQGNPLTAVQVGQQFNLNLIGVDARTGLSTDPIETQRNGIFAAFADILFNNTLVRPVSGTAIQFSDRFPTVQKGTFSNGLIDELGAATDRLTPSRLEDSLVATIRMEALGTGSVNFRSEPADAVDSEVLLYGSDNRIPAGSVAYGSVQLAIGQNFTVADDAVTVTQGSGVTRVDVLANDVVVSGGGALTLVSVTQPTEGASVSISNGQVAFLLEDTFVGNFNFTYRVRDAQGIQEDATVNVTVVPANGSNPTAVADSFTVNQGSSANSLNVLANDTLGTGSTGTLRVTAVGSSANGGTITIATGGTAVLYTPSSTFTGTDTFTYTLSDGARTSQGSVSVLVKSTDNPPTAVADTFTVVEDALVADFDVLVNDTRDSDNQVFTLNAVGTPDQGGTASISSSGKISYKPKANFNGTEKVTYTIRDTGGGTSTATVTFNVTAINDLPPFLNTTVQLTKGGVEKVVLAKSSLPANVDTGETLTFTNLGTPTAGGTVRVDSATGSIFYKAPSATFTGTDTFTYSVSDGSSATSSGTITVNVADFFERDLYLSFPASIKPEQLSGIKLMRASDSGTTTAIEIPLSVANNAASFQNILPGEYTIEIPAMPFFSQSAQARSIPVTSAPEDGDATIDVAIGDLLPQYIDIRDWLGSTPRRSLLVAVEPGKANTVVIPTASVTALTNPVVTLDAAAQNLTIQATQSKTDSTTGAVTTSNVEAKLPTANDKRVQSRGQVGTMRLFRVSVADDVTFNPATASTSTSGTTASGEFIEPSAISSPSISIGSSSADGGTLAATSVSQTDVFVPASRDASTRSDATVLPLESGDIWVGENLKRTSRLASSQVAPVAVDSAMQDIASEVRLVSKTGDLLAEGDLQSGLLDEAIVDAALSDL